MGRMMEKKKKSERDWPWGWVGDQDLTGLNRVSMRGKGWIYRQLGRSMVGRRFQRGRFRGGRERKARRFGLTGCGEKKKKKKTEKKNKKK